MIINKLNSTMIWRNGFVIGALTEYMCDVKNARFDFAIPMLVLFLLVSVHRINKH